MKRFDHTPERSRKEKIAERQTLEQRKAAKDKRYYVVDEDEDSYMDAELPEEPENE